MLLSLLNRDHFHCAIGEMVTSCFAAAFAGEDPDANLARALPVLVSGTCLPPPAALDALARVEAARGWLEEARSVAASECLGEPYDEIVSPWALRGQSNLRT